MNRKTNLILSSGLAMAGGLAITLGGVGGCSKPPPVGSCCASDGSCSISKQADCGSRWNLNGACSPNPCPQPVPPPPPEITLESVAQSEHADPRVQFAADLKVEESNLELAKAIVHLADAFARGDAKALKPLLSRRAQTLLDDLQTSGQWEESTKQIEAVRIVLVRDGVDFTGIGAAKVPAGEVPLGIMQKLTQALKGLPPEQLAAITKAAAEAGDASGADPAALAADPAKMAEFQTKVTEAMKAAGVSEETMNKFAEMSKDVPAEAAPAVPSGPSGMGIAIAVQDIHGAYLLTWAAEKFGEKWGFTNAPATPEIRRRASLWDNVGNEAFQAMALATLPAAGKFNDDSGGGMKSSGGDSGGGGEAPPAAPSPDAPSNPVPTINPGAPGKHPHG